MNASDELAELMAEVPHAVSQNRGEVVLQIAGYSIRYPRGLLIAPEGTEGPGIRFRHQLRYVRLFRKATLESTLATIILERGDGRLVRVGYRRYVFVQRGTAATIDWRAIATQVKAIEANAPGTIPHDLKLQLFGRLLFSRQSAEELAERIAKKQH